MREDVYHVRVFAAAYRQEARPTSYEPHMQQRQQWRGEDSVPVPAAAFCTGETWSRGIYVEGTKGALHSMNGNMYVARSP